MSHIVTVATKIHDPTAVSAACRRLRLSEPVHGTAELFSSKARRLRDNDGLRQHMATQLAGVQSVLDGMMVDRPRRRIIRQSQQEEGGGH